MRVPDYISPIVGYRVWQWDATGLKSLNGRPWLPGKPLSAACGIEMSRMLTGRAEQGQVTHDAPQLDCSCGVYSAKSLDHLRRTVYMQYGIFGEVYLWGTVVEHEAGWRAQHAYPKNFVLPLSMMPVSMSRVELWLKTLTEFGCDIFVHSKQRDVPLWQGQSGYEAAGLDVLVQRCKDWYARRGEQRRIKFGDRVAVLGRGIAVVEQVDGKEVHALLWNRDTVRVRRREIVWDGGNMRWETAVVAGINTTTKAMSSVFTTQ